MKTGPDGRPVLDDLDRQIVRFIADGGPGVTQAQLGSFIGRSKSTTLTRVRRLEGAGLLKPAPPGACGVLALADEVFVDGDVIYLAWRVPEGDVASGPLAN